MAQIAITINSREYAIACEDGQEGRILQLAGILDEKAKMFAGQIGENTLLVMVGLVIADELAESKKNGTSNQTQSLDSQQISGIDKDVSKRIKIAAEDINGLANKLNLL